MKLRARNKPVGTVLGIEQEGLIRVMGRQDAAAALCRPPLGIIHF
jgi:hypothetical protein